jgi:hypothetical protein
MQYDLLPAIARMGQQTVGLKEWLRFDEELRLEQRPTHVADLFHGRSSRSGTSVGTSMSVPLQDPIMEQLAVETLADPGKCFLSGKHVHVVAVDKRAVDVEENGLDLHACAGERVGANVLSKDDNAAV